MSATPTPRTLVDPAAALSNAFRDAIAKALDLDPASVEPAVRPSPAPKSAKAPRFGDFQCNAAMGLAKARGENPREVAATIVEALDADELVESCEVAGPGFINVTLRSEALSSRLTSIDDTRLGVATSGTGHVVAVDLCGVNVAKQMHVGHLRATIIGDTLARVHEHLDYTVHRENHLGDWGLPIAMTLSALRRDGTDLDTITLDDLNRAYRDAQLDGKADERGLAAAHAMHCGPHRVAELECQNDAALAIVREAKDTLVKLQAGDAELVADWRKIIECTMNEVWRTLAPLNVKIGPEHSRGESFFGPRLPEVIDAFVREGVAVEDDGALVVRFDDRERPLLIRKSDGGFLYATTDLAALRFRVHDLASERVVYVVDARQREHFRDVFDAARKMHWDRTPAGVTADLVHLPFGAVLGPDKRPLKTRSGDNFTLMALLQEAIDRGTHEVVTRASDPNAPTHGQTESELHAIGRAVGIAAVKYADLSSDVARDYVFDLDRMIAFEGDTGPYLLYAHARIASMLAKADADGVSIGESFAVHEDAERQLALALLRFGATIEDVAEKLEPNRLCAYLFDLANTFSSFYQSCPVLRAEPDVRAARLRLCDLTRRVLRQGLELLGIEAPERM